MSVHVLLAAIILALAVPADASAYSTAALKDKDVKRAEKIIIKLRRLEAVSTSPADFHAYKTAMEDMYPGLFVDASQLGESDLKTDLTTAVFLYERAYRTGSDSDARITDCDGEMRAIYLKLCLESRAGEETTVGLLRSKARLHTKWAEAVVRYYRGAADAGALAELSELEAERKVDIFLAEEALVSLKRVAAQVGDLSSLEAFEAAMRANKVSFDELSREITDALSTVDRVLASIPRGPLHLMLRNARHSYTDGLFWWGKTSPTRSRTVSANNLIAADPLKAIGLTPDAANSTALANWRSALRYTREVEKAIGGRRG